MIKHKEKNKYSLNAESYDISKKKWKDIKELVISFNINSSEARIRFKLNEVEKANKIEIDEEMCKTRIWFLYDVLLQEKYNHLYKRDKLVNPKVGDFCYCDYEGFGRGVIKTVLPNHNQMFIKFDNRRFQTLCDSKLMITISDDIKRKITRI